MTRIPGEPYKRLHNEDGSHICTAPTANGRDLERHERLIKRHLELHKQQDKPTETRNGHG